ncbi:MAG: hypothetical protein AAFU67_04525, partial [Bacteroidota bacterium]
MLLRLGLLIFGLTQVPSLWSQHSNEFVDLPPVVEVKNMLDTVVAPIDETSLLLRLAVTYLNYVGNIDSTEKYLNLAEQKARQHDIPKFVGSVYLIRASLAKKAHEMGDAVNLFHRGIEQYRIAKDTVKLGVAYYNLGVLYQDMGNNSACLENLLTARELLWQVHDTSRLLGTAGALALAYRRMDQLNKSTQTLEEMAPFVEQANHEDRLMWYEDVGSNAAKVYQANPNDSILWKGLRAVYRGIAEADSLHFKTMMAELRRTKLVLHSFLDTVSMEEDLKLMDTIITLGKELNDTYLVHQTTMNKQQVV